MSTGVKCGPGFDVEVRAPDGTTSFVLRGRPAICPLFDSNILEPGETDTVAVFWRVPLAAGRYTLVGGIETRAGFAARSTPKTVEVRGFTR